MRNNSSTPENYIESLSDGRKEPFRLLRKTIKENLPAGFEEIMAYGMISFVIPHSIYPRGYHVNPKQALPFLSIASQKNFIAVYHMGIYSNENLKNWFVNEYPNHSKSKPDMGKSCIRFSNTAHIPYSLIGELCTKISVEKWIEMYESALIRKK